MTTLEERNRAAAKSGGFWSYLRHRQVDVYPSGALRWWLLSLVVLAWAIEQFENLKIGPVLVYVLDEFDVTISRWGQVLAVAGFAYGVGSITLTRLADRFGRRPLLIWPIVIYIGIALAAANAPNFLTLAGLTVLGGFTIAGMNPAVHAASRDVSPQMGRAFAYSWISLAFTAGALLSTTVAARTLPIWPGWRPQFWIAAVFALVTAVVMAIFYRDLSPQVRGQIVRERGEGLVAAPSRPAEDDAPQGYLDGRLVYRSGRLWLLAATLLFWSLTYVTVTAYVPTYLTQHFGTEPARAAAVTSYFWLVFTVSVFVSGWLSDRLQVRKTVTAFGGLCTGLCFFVAASLPQDASYATLAVTWSLTGWFAGFIYPAWCAVYSETAEGISPYGVARAFGITGAMWPLAAIVLNLGLPRIVESHGWPVWMRIAGLSCLGCAVLVSFGHGPWWITRERDPVAPRQKGSDAVG